MEGAGTGEHGQIETLYFMGVSCKTSTRRSQCPSRLCLRRSPPLSTDRLAGHGRNLAPENQDRDVPSDRRRRRKQTRASRSRCISATYCRVERRVPGEISSFLRRSCVAVVSESPQNSTGRLRPTVPRAPERALLGPKHHDAHEDVRFLGRAN